MTDYNLTVNVNNQGIPPILDVVQGDSGRNIIITIADMDITGYVARVYVVKPSGLDVYENAAVRERTITVELTNQMLAEVGNTKMQVSVYRGITSAERVTTFNVYLNVEASLQDNGLITSSAEYAALDEAVAVAMAAAEKINTLKYAASPTVGGNATCANKVLNALTISLNGTSQGSYDGSAAKNINITPEGIGVAATIHKHSAGDITSGALAISRGGTGASTVSAARNNLGLGNTSGPLPISCGGTGASTVAELKDNLGLNAATCVSRDMGKYVDAKSGSDANDGAIDTPYKTIAKALDYFPKNLGGRSVRIILNSSGYTEFNDGITVSGFYNGTLIFEKRSPNNVDTDRAVIRGNINLSNNDARVILKGIEVVGDNTTHAITVSNTSMVGVKSCRVSGAASYAGIYTTRNGRLSVADTMIHSCDMGIYMYSATALSAETAVNMLAVSNVTTHSSAGYKNRLGYSLNGCIMFAAHNKADLPELGVSNFGYYGLTVIYKDSAI